MLSSARIRDANRLQNTKECLYIVLAVTGLRLKGNLVILFFSHKLEVSTKENVGSSVAQLYNVLNCYFIDSAHQASWRSP